MTVTACAVDETREARGIDEIDNPYWDAVKGDVTIGDRYSSASGGAVVGDLFSRGRSEQDFLRSARVYESRWDLARKYAFTIPDPPTLEFILRYGRDGILDPMAGTGYWAWMLNQLGVDVLAYDQHPPDLVQNFYHHRNPVHFPVRRGHAQWVAKRRGRGRTLLLSWPPMNRDGAETVASFTGDRIIYIGEGPGGCCGDDALFELLDSRWREVATHRPVQWSGIHDYVVVYDRLPPWSITRRGDSGKVEAVATLKGLLAGDSLSEEERQQAEFLIKVLDGED